LEDVNANRGGWENYKGFSDKVLGVQPHRPTNFSLSLILRPKRTFRNQRQTEVCRT
jgi:hypothetical protein